jgi:hypothetical protein
MFRNRKLFEERRKMMSEEFLEWIQKGLGTHKIQRESDKDHNHNV